MVFTRPQTSFLYSKESSYGSPIAPAKTLGYMTKPLEFKPTNNLYEGFYTGAIENKQLVPTFYEFKGACEIDCSNFRALELAFGGTVTHAETTGDWKHTFSGANAIIPFTTDVGLDGTSDKVFRYAGCAIETLTINLNTDRPVNMGLDCVAKTVDTSQSTASSQLYDSLDLFVPAQVTISVGGSTISLVKGITLTIENSLAEARYLGSAVRQHAVPTKRRYGITFNYDFENLTEYQRFLGGAAVTAPANTQPTFTTIINANNGVTLGSGRREINIEIDGCKYASASETYPEDSVANLEMSITGGQLDTSNTYSVDNISNSNF